MDEPTQDSLFGGDEQTTIDTELHMAMHRCWVSAGMLASEMTRPDPIPAEIVDLTERVRADYNRALNRSHHIARAKGEPVSSAEPIPRRPVAGQFTHVLATTDDQLSESMIVAGESVVMVDLARFTRMWAVASQASLYLGLEDDFGLTNEHTQGKRADLLASIREMEEREAWLRRQRGDTASSDQPEEDV